MRRCLSGVRAGLICLVTGSLAVGICGCAGLPAGLAPGLVSSEPMATAEPRESVVVEIISGKKPQVAHVPWQPNMRLDDALRLARAHKKFHRMQITLVRQGPEGRPQKMEARFDAATRHVPPAYDYALYPGDRLVVRRDSYGMLDKMVEDTLGPLARLHSSRP
ncbi:MAG: hypothetical protein KatS3mg110_0972 [Pirellulaceae bacterium]|nr:MAG: hypothetical protein KatS3mg110_0972 [Pirellulaceae bacterium]